MNNHTLFWEGLRSIMRPVADKNGLVRLMETEYRKDFEFMEKNLGRPITNRDARIFLNSR